MKPTYEELTVQLANAESKCRGLAAENAHMQQVIGDVQTLYYESDGIVGYHLNGDIAKWDDVMPDLWSETPATDAFLAEVRAQARNEFINELESRFNEMTETLPPELRSGAAGAAAFVSTFRKGAAL
ncbi:TPA: hypothetical protein R8G76_003127 [Citrobacter youngae]|nr:hypothetical protein [Citrobacter youngae]